MPSKIVAEGCLFFNIIFYVQKGLTFHVNRVLADASYEISNFNFSEKKVKTLSTAVVIHALRFFFFFFAERRTTHYEPIASFKNQIN